MKKNFIKPSAEFVSILSEQMLAISSRDGGDFSGGGDNNPFGSRKQNNTTNANPADKTMPQGIEF